MSPERPDLSHRAPEWISAETSPFGVRVLDVRPVTLGTLSMSRDPRMASNALSYNGEDGSSFADEAPVVARRVDATLRFIAPERLVDGALFIPREMEDKWALFVARGELVFVRGWQRRVFLRAAMRVEGGELVIGPFDGALSDAGEDPAFTVRAADFLLRALALGLPWPAPVPGESAPHSMAVFCMSQFGRSAHYAAVEALPRDVPTKPLRVMSRLHRAVLRDDVEGARAALDAGVPVDLEDKLGASAMQYVRTVGPMLALLAERGADLDAASDDGVRPLMMAAQARSLPLVRWLLERGVVADAADARGFTALHRAAEMGEAEMVDALLARGADPKRESVSGVTPLELATQRGHEAIVRALSR